jgi:hypothetical protein
MSNWRHLNLKVLRVLRCELSEEQMAGFSSRRSDDDAADFLQQLRHKLSAFEPLYFAEYQSAADPESQARVVARLSGKSTPRSSTAAEVPSKPAVSSPSKEKEPAVPLPPPPPPAAAVTPRALTVTSEPLPARDQLLSRRPSAIKSTMILEA